MEKEGTESHLSQYRDRARERTVEDIYLFWNILEVNNWLKSVKEQEMMKLCYR
jgi:hypothetical protein